MKNRAAFLALMTGISEVHRFKFSDAMLEIWWQCLTPHDDETVKVAVYRHITDPELGKYTPKPGEIIGLCLEIERNERIRQRASMPALTGPKIQPAPWVHRMVTRFVGAMKRRAPAAEVRQIIEDAARERREANSTTKGEGHAG